MKQGLQEAVKLGLFLQHISGISKPALAKTQLPCVLQRLHKLQPKPAVAGRCSESSRERGLRNHIAGLQRRRSICAAVHMKVGRLFPLLRNLVALSLFYSLHYRTLHCIFLQEILHSFSHQLACVGHQ